MGFFDALMELAAAEEWVGKDVERYPELPWKDPSVDSAGAFGTERPQLDDTPREAEDERRFYELAKKVWDAAPWEELPETDVVAIPLSNGRKRYMSVMGARGEYRALAFYPDFATFAAIHRLSSAEDALWSMPALVSMWQWQVAFLSKRELLPGEAESIRASGVKFPRGVHPAATAWTPGFMPGRPGGRELRELNEAMEAALEFFDDPIHLETPIVDEFKGTATVGTWKTSPETGRRELGEEEASAAFRCPLNLPPDLLARFRALPVAKKTRWSLGEVTGTAEPGPGMTREPMDRWLILLDERLPTPPVGPFRQNRERAFQFSDLLAAYAEMMVKEGVVAGKLSSLGGVSGLVARRLAELHPGGVKYDAKYHSQRLEETLRIVTEQMTADGE
ncbi:MAG: hypothetical protein IK066_09900 [Kiritimatiellae bacterium]|nr:hypothetical protein [Kiritimatiellia bacterium]